MNISTIITYIENRYSSTDKQNAKWLNSKTLSMLYRNNAITFGDYFRLSSFNSKYYRGV